MRHPQTLSCAAFAVASLTALALAVPARAQPTSVDELTVTAHAQRHQLQSLSEVVSYADLDLNRPHDRAKLNYRISAAAGRVCDQLNEERPHAANLGRSCQDLAVQGAMGQVRVAIADARNGRAGPAYAQGYAAEASAVVPASDTVASPPVPDTRANRARYGGPMSHAGRRTAASGN